MLSLRYPQRPIAIACILLAILGFMLVVSVMLRSDPADTIRLVLPVARRLAVMTLVPLP